MSRDPASQISASDSNCRHIQISSASPQEDDLQTTGHCGVYLNRTHLCLTRFSLAAFLFALLDRAGCYPHFLGCDHPLNEFLAIMPHRSSLRSAQMTHRILAELNVDTRGLLIMPCAALLLLWEPSLAHTGDVIYPILEVPSSDVPTLTDGTLDDWELALPNSSLSQSDFVAAVSDGSEKDLSDLAFRVFLAWNSNQQKLYFAIERLDDDFIPTRNRVGEGSIRIMLDGDHSGGDFLFVASSNDEETSRRYTGAQAQLYSLRPVETEALSQLTVSMLGSQGWARVDPWTGVGGFHRAGVPALSVFELSVTLWDDLHPDGVDQSRQSSLHPGKIIGFQVEVSDLDNDDTGLQSFRLGGLQNPDGSFTADDFADGELVPCNISDCTGSASSSVAMDSWARIKAGL